MCSFVFGAELSSYVLGLEYVQRLLHVAYTIQKKGGVLAHAWTCHMACIYAWPGQVLGLFIQVCIINTI
jgi:hypothetical protein